jgi:hypothetical protein
MTEQSVAIQSSDVNNDYEKAIAISAIDDLFWVENWPLRIFHPVFIKVCNALFDDAYQRITGNIDADL